MWSVSQITRTDLLKTGDHWTILQARSKCVTCATQSSTLRARDAEPFFSTPRPGRGKPAREPSTA